MMDAGMSQKEQISEFPLLRYDTFKGWSDAVEEVAVESPLTINVNGSEFATVVCSPWELETMAVGFLCSEGVLRSPDDLADITVDPEQGIAAVTVEGYEDNVAGKLFLKRYINSCCGRSRASFYYSTDAMLCNRVEGGAKIDIEVALKLMDDLLNHSEMFRRTGGVHGGLLADRDRILCFHEDIGRNNVLDRIYGQCYLEGIDMGDKVVAFSGRISSEIALKMSKMGIPILVGHSAPTDLALSLADDLGITVMGFARSGRVNVYTHPERVLDVPAHNLIPLELNAGNRSMKQGGTNHDDDRQGDR